MRSLLLLACGLLALSGGCLVQSQCQSHADCCGTESCERQSGTCRVECVAAQDCWVGGVPVGKQCINHRCEFSFAEGVKAPGFCLEVVNPKSVHYSKELCLEQLKGKVVMIYFALLA